MFNASAKNVTPNFNISYFYVLNREFGNKRNLIKKIKKLLLLKTLK